MINVIIKEELFWKKYKLSDNIEVWLKGYIYSNSINEILSILKKIKKDEVEKFINSIDGHFAIIYISPTISFIAVDKIRSTPLFFIKNKNCFDVSSNPNNLIEQNYFEKTVNSNAKLEISMSGFTIGNKTFFNNLFSLKAGEIVFFNENNYNYLQYYKYFGPIINKNYETYLDELSSITIKVFKKLISDIGNRQIVIPLSAGNDSRLIASVLKYLDVDNVLCYSYGTKNNFEAEIASLISNKLGYKWVFIPLTHKSEKEYYKSSDYKDFLKYSETYSSIPYLQSLSTIKYLKELNLLEKDAIFINGNSGDFISGSHINKLMTLQYSLYSKEDRKNNILDSLIDKHFSLWESFKTEDNINKIKENLWDEITDSCGELKSKEQDHLFYEYSECIDRQCSYVISGQRAYEFYGYEWRMPLWDDEYLEFFVKVPASFKMNQKLYVDMLKKNNFGKVWGDDIPINNKNLSPKWIIPVRFIFKMIFAIFGRKGKLMWKNFEVSFFHYWMDVIHLNDLIPFTKRFKFFKRSPRSVISYITEDYIKRLECER